MPADTTLDKAIYLMLLNKLWGLPFLSVGNVFFVDGVNGNDGNDGTSPNSPWLTVAFALTQCVNDNDDVIVLMDAWNEATPVAINVTRVHIIGVSRNPNSPLVVWTATGDTAIFTVSALSNNCEIAGISFGGGATHAAIENVGGTPMNLYIHDCAFGQSFAGDTPQDGIRIEINATGIRIENCSFFGTAAGAGGTITRDGIRFQGGGIPLSGVIKNCMFNGCPGVAIDFVTVAAGSGGITIQDNIIACDADTQGSAITLGATCAGFLVVGNKALFGDGTVAMVQNPFLDSAAAQQNHWAGNMKGSVFTDPA